MQRYEELGKKFIEIAQSAGYHSAFFFDSTDSTNTEAKRWLRGDALHAEPLAQTAQTAQTSQTAQTAQDLGNEDMRLPQCSRQTKLAETPLAVEKLAVFWSLEQLAGRGRHGRQWVSENSAGIYMSFALRTKELAPFSIIAGAALCKALRDRGYDALLKWPNDVLVNGKKVAGILTELVTDIPTKEWGNTSHNDIPTKECENISHADIPTKELEEISVVVGVGLNISGGFSGELSEKAGSLADFKACRIGSAGSEQKAGSGSMAGSQQKAGSVKAVGSQQGEGLERWVRLMIDSVGRGIALKPIFNKYIEFARQTSATIDNAITVSNVGSGEGAYNAVARDICDDGALLIELPDGELRKISAGEITLSGGAQPGRKR